MPHDTGDRYKKIFGKIYKNVNQIIVHSANTKIEIVESFHISEDKISVIPHGLLELNKNTKEDTVLDLIGQVEKKYFLKSKTVFVLVGTINDYKGISLLFETWSKAELANNSNIHLFVAGKGNHPSLKGLADFSNVTIKNQFMSNEEFLMFLRIADYILLPYLKISQSGVLLTAITERKRVIVSNVGGLAEPFNYGNIGYVLPKIDSISLKNAILEAIEDVNEVPQDSVWETIERAYQWESIGFRTQELYQII